MGTYTELQGGRLYLEGSATTTFTPPSLPDAGAKLVAVFYESGTSVITVNGIELAVGGLFLVSNPNPSAGIDSIAIVHTADATVRIRVLG